jgi:hypothetical protein
LLTHFVSNAVEESCISYLPLPLLFVIPLVVIPLVVIPHLVVIPLGSAFHHTQQTVISTEADHSLIVVRVVEKPPHLHLPLHSL